MYVAPPGQEVAVPRLYHGRCPQTCVGDPPYGVRPVVYEAQGTQLFQDVELVLRRNRKAHIRTKMCPKPVFEMGVMISGSLWVTK